MDILFCHEGFWEFQVRTPHTDLPFSRPSEKRKEGKGKGAKIPSAVDAKVVSSAPCRIYTTANVSLLGVPQM